MKTINYAYGQSNGRYQPGSRGSGGRIPGRIELKSGGAPQRRPKGDPTLGALAAGRAIATAGTLAAGRAIATAGALAVGRAIATAGALAMAGAQAMPGILWRAGQAEEMNCWRKSGGKSHSSWPTACAILCRASLTLLLTVALSVCSSSSSDSDPESNDTSESNGAPSDNTNNTTGNTNRGNLQVGDSDTTAPVYQEEPRLMTRTEESIALSLTLSEDSDVHYILLPGGELQGAAAPNSQQIIAATDAEGRQEGDSGGPSASGSERATATAQLVIVVDQLPHNSAFTFYLVAVDLSDNHNAAAIKTLEAATLEETPEEETPEEETPEEETPEEETPEEETEEETLTTGRPILSNPRLGELTAATAKLIFDLADSDAATSDRSSIHWLALPASEATEPTAQQVADGETAIAAATALAGQEAVAAQGSDLEITALGLDGSIAYRFYAVAEDSAGNISDLTHIGEEAPALPATTTLSTIDGNSFGATLAENSRANTEIFDIGAELSGAEQVTYEITAVTVTDLQSGGDDDPASKFRIDADGVIQTTATAIDYDILIDPFAYTLTISAAVQNDRGSQIASATLTVAITDDGFIKIGNLAQLNAMRYDMDGDGIVDSSSNQAARTAYEESGLGSESCATDGSCNGYELVADIDLGGSASPWIPVGDCGSNGSCGDTDNPDTPENENDDAPFTAIFEGNGHTLSNLYIRGDSANADILGLFAFLNGATARNLVISEIDIQALYAAGGEDNQIGALAGRLDETSLILNVEVSDSDDSIDLQGAATSDIQHIGGLVGFQYSSSIIASRATVSVSSGGAGKNHVGGLVGRQAGDNSKIASSFAIGAVAGGAGAENIGGLVGLQIGAGNIIVSSYATGAVNGAGGDDSAGGLLGLQAGGSIIASFAAGSVDGGSGDPSVGKLLGANPGAPLGFASVIKASYGFGAATGETNTIGQHASVTAAADLTTANSGSLWSASTWDFGDSTQIPALKYVTSYDSGADPALTAYSCNGALLPASVTCGSLLPGQR